MDVDNSGTLTLEELKDGLAKQGSTIAESEAYQLLDAVYYEKMFSNLYFASMF